MSCGLACGAPTILDSELESRDVAFEKLFSWGGVLLLVLYLCRMWFQIFGLIDNC